MKKEYYLGLDMGTESVGWAVADETYHVCKKNQKALWGVRLFDESLSAEKRRFARIGRRRIERRNQRLGWLQEQFAQAIGQVDSGFFQRLQEGFYRPEDKSVPGKYTLFCDKNYCDWDYHHQYPTIYHLRYALATQPGPFDVRLVYLAVHHILKKRGHFLFGQLSMDQITFEGCLETLATEISIEFDMAFAVEHPDKLKLALQQQRVSKAQKKKSIWEAIGDVPSGMKSLLELLAGSKVKVTAIFEDLEPNSELASFSLEEDFTELEPKLFAAVGEERTALIGAVKSMYDYILLEKLRDGETFLSAAKIKSYEKHRSDLTQLKAIFRRLCPNEYHDFFHKSEGKRNNYIAYTGHDCTANYRCNREDFVKELNKKLAPFKSDTIVDRILEELAQETFLPMQATSANGVIPHQLHKMELEAILENATCYLPFLLEADETGLLVKDKILAMFHFRIPYYVGPLSQGSPFAWLTRTDEKIYPWNFSQVVDLEKSAESFITRMTAKCSYLGEDVTPKDSLLYSRFMVLNTLNKIKISDEPITVTQKQDIYNNLFLTGKKVTEKMLKGYCISQGYMTKADTIQGLDKEFKSTLAPYVIFNDYLKNPEQVTMVEDIITHIVLFSEDHHLLSSWLHKHYGHVLSGEEQKRILTKKFSGWSSLSRVLLTEIYHTIPATGEVKSIMDMLWESNDNLMELLSSKYIFGQAITAYRRAKMEGQGFSLADYLKESYAAPGIKRAIFQTMAITNEVTKIMGGTPKRIFVEVAREDGEKKATVSRKNRLIALYKDCKETSTELFARLEGEPEGDLRRDKLFLYYTQFGKCMYSGNPISLEELDSKYDIDHIYPQSLTKDDSLNNRVLVLKTLNGAKSNTFPVAEDIRRKMQPFWAELQRKGMISKEKYQRLTRTTELTTQELEGFIARQLVETRQSTKIVSNLLEKLYPESEVVYVKAGHVSNFRQEQKIWQDKKQVQDPLFVKCREVNDFHHAKDAYLNIVVGNVYHVKFTKNPKNFLKSGVPYSLNRMYDFDVIRGQDVAWEKGEDGTIATVRHAMGKNNILFTRMTRDVGGALYDLQIMPKGKGQTAIKTSDSKLDVANYGGYNKRTGAYFILVAHTQKKKRIRSIEAIFLMDQALYESDPVAYCTNQMQLVNPQILVKHIPINTLFSLDGFRMMLTGRTGKQLICRNANQLVLSKEDTQYIKELEKYHNRCAIAKQELPLTVFDKVNALDNQRLYWKFVDKLEHTIFGKKYKNELQKLQNKKDVFNGLTTGEQCTVLLEILNMFNANAKLANLSLLKESSSSGTIQPSKNIDLQKSKPFHIIYQSPTGFFETAVNLLASEDAF